MLAVHRDNGIFCDRTDSHHTDLTTIIDKIILISQTPLLGKNEEFMKNERIEIWNILKIGEL